MVSPRGHVEAVGAYRAQKQFDLRLLLVSPDNHVVTSKVISRGAYQTNEANTQLFEISQQRKREDHGFDRTCTNKMKGHLS
jgi:hypothetical protein